MPDRLGMDEAAARIAALTGPVLIGIDGLPCSGKSTLADMVAQQAGFECLSLDDFVLPEAEWPSHIRPAFPFEYMRYAAFLGAIGDLATQGACVYQSFDWATLEVETEPRHLRLDKPILVEGVSALNPAVEAYYELRVFVESDRATVLEAAAARGMGGWATEWKSLFLPSADLYMATHPEHRADLLVAGRGR